MLNSLRRSAGTWVVKAFLGVLVLSFAVWGIADIFRIRPSQSVAEVGDIQISGQELLDEFNAEMRQMQRTFGPKFDRQQARAVGLVDRSLERLIQKALYDQEVHRLGLTLPDAEVAARIRSNRIFQGQNGTFDRFVYEQMLQRAGLSEDQFVAMTRADGARSQLISSITGGVQVPDAMVQALFRYQQEKRTFELLRIPDDKMTGLAEPSADDLKAYYEKHKDAFKAPEYRTLSWLTIRPEDLTGEVKVTDKELRDAYDARKDQFTQPEQRKLEQIVVQDEDAAKKAEAGIKGGKDFYAVAKDVAGQDKETTQLGFVTRQDLLGDIADTVFALKQGAVSAPLKSPLGWHVFRVEEIKQGSAQSLDQVRDKLTRTLKLEKARDVMFGLANKVDDGIAGGSKLEEVAGQLNLPHGKIAGIDSRGNDREGQPVKDLPKAPEFLQTAFSQEAGEEPTLQESSDGSYFLVRVDEVTPPTVRPLDAVKDEVHDKVMAERRDKAAAKRADALAAQAREGKTLAALAEQHGLQVSATTPLTRSQASAQAELSTALVKDLFERPQGGIASGAGLHGDAHVVARVKEIKPADPKADAEQLARLRNTLARGMSGDMLTQYEAALRKHYDVEINERRIDGLFNDVGVRG